MPKNRNINHGNYGEIGYFKIALLTIFAILLTFCLVFLSAGRITYWQGWAFCGIILLITVFQIALFSDEIDLAKERLKPGPGVKWWDKIFYALFKPAFLAVIILACLDAGRYVWSPRLPLIVYTISYPLFLLSIFMLIWAMKTNKFFSSMVRIQSDRGHFVVTDGPYRYVRHPGYTGGILMAVTTPLILGSLWGLIPAGAVVILIIARTVLEDRTLKKELSGYAEYAKKVRYKVFAGIW
ncbi:MAG: isoprenylcysteine carboxylmethyltransferase family protein [Deltaproteobacteria bacterium]|uniref:Isoprenylcysteine carboxylmethyltransferase family protein n=1 Tax=Candidatus Zymogenus saltonus TaxID=2844893 RepID=A0A9D8KAJ4_9DELT|nr:isoprenylcysteine carboxylmethyltransferase family protein [Candidatus Zymogenus saltonus]